MSVARIWIIIIAGVISIITGGAARGQTMVQFPASDPHTHSKVTLRGELVVPEGKGRFPAVVLMHGCQGWTRADLAGLRDHARALNGAGFATLVLDSFGPRRLGRDGVCDEPQAALDASAYRTADAYDALRYLRSRADIDGGNVFQMGQSLGGGVAIRLAQSPSMLFSGAAILGQNAQPFRAVAAFYPPCSFMPPRQLEQITDLIVFAGVKDTWTPPGACQGSKNARGFTYDLIVYRGAVHSFDLPMKVTGYLGHRVGLNRTARADSRRRMIQFFKERLR